MKQKNAVRMVWRWDDIFRVYRCPYCGRPEKPCFELWKKGGLKKSLPSRCTYCKGELEGVEGEEMIIEILELAAALEWIALGVLVFFKLRSLKRQAEVVLETLDAAAWKSIKQEEEVWRKNTPNEIRAAFGFPPITPTEYTEMKIREETDR